MHRPDTHRPSDEASVGNSLLKSDLPTAFAAGPDIDGLRARLVETVGAAADVAFEVLETEAGCRLLGRVMDPGGATVGTLDYVVDSSNGIAVLNEIELDHRHRGARVGPAIMLATLRWLSAPGAGIRRVRFVANREGGAYSWAACGFRPTPASWPAIAGRIEDVLWMFQEQLPAATVRRLRAIHQQGPSAMELLSRIATPQPGDSDGLPLARSILSETCRFEVELDLTDYRARSEIIRRLRARIDDM